MSPEQPAGSVTSSSGTTSWHLDDVPGRAVGTGAHRTGEKVDVEVVDGRALLLHDARRIGVLHAEEEDGRGVVERGGALRSGGIDACVECSETGDSSDLVVDDGCLVVDGVGGPGGDRRHALVRADAGRFDDPVT